jgi:hypothetical protein
LTFLALATALCLVFASTSMRIVGGELVPPLDDAFIHFQYARRLAEGHPFSYQSGDAWSSGATSLVWPAILAVGWKLGFEGMRLYVWALGVCTVFLASTAASTRAWLARVSDDRTALFGALLLLLTGPLLWGAFSGMEVIVFGAAIAGVLEGLSRPGRPPGVPAPGTLSWAALLAVVRPEGAVLAGLLALLQLAEAWYAGGRRVRALLPALVWLLPVALGTIQPLLNHANTGLWASSSGLAKRNPRWTHPAEVNLAAFVWYTMIGLGYGDFFGHFAPTALVLFAVGAGSLLLRDHARGAPGLGVVALVWWAAPLPLLGLLMPLCWHHYRYLMPYLVIFVPILALGAATIDRAIARFRSLEAGRDIAASPLVLGTVLVCLGGAGFAWMDELGRNARDIREHQVELGRWLATHTRPDTLVAANDVGALAYLGERRVYDLEGIVTMAALPAALAGEGSVYAELLQVHPNLLVVFPTWYEAIFGAGAMVIRRHDHLTHRSISGGEDLVVATLDDAVTATAGRPPPLAANEHVVDTLDVSDLRDEAAHAFRFAEVQPIAGRANTAVSGSYADGTRVVDSARRMGDGATFRMDRGSGPATLVGRFGPSEGASRLAVRVDGRDAGTWDIPANASGTWSDEVFPLPPGTGTVSIEVIPVDVAYGPAGGWHVARLWTVAAG